MRNRAHITVMTVLLWTWLRILTEKQAFTVVAAGDSWWLENLNWNWCNTGRDTLEAWKMKMLTKWPLELSSEGTYKKKSSETVDIKTRRVLKKKREENGNITAILYLVVAGDASAKPNILPQSRTSEKSGVVLTWIHSGCSHHLNARRTDHCGSTPV